MSNPSWLNVLRCPQCKGELTQTEHQGAAGLSCVTDALFFPIRDGMPIMLIEQAIALNSATHVVADAS